MGLINWHLDLEQIEVSEEWNFPNIKEDSIHRIHSYPAKFPSFITTKAIEYAKNHGVNVNTLGDLFCGCGTTAFEAKKANINYWGCDINPVATLIAKVKSESYNIGKLYLFFENIMQEYDKFINIPRSIDFITINERIKYWFTESSINELYYLKMAINNVKPRMCKYKNFFLVAFSNILKPSSKWLTKSIKPQIDPKKKEINIKEAFIIQVNTMIKAYSKVHSDFCPQIKIETKNVLKENGKDIKVDLIVTSPPYVTSYEYADLHQLSTLWLDYTNDYRSLRKGTIGSVYDTTRFKKDIKLLNSTAESIVFQLYTKDTAKSKSAARYYVDMQNVVKISYNKLTPKGIAVFVIGNTEYMGVRINNAQHLAQAMQQEGYKNLEIVKRKISRKILTPYRDDKGMFTSALDGRKVYSEEFIVIGKKE